METFLYHGRTKEGFETAVGGFCKKGLKGKLLHQMKGLSDYTFGSHTAAYIIDYRLFQLVTDLLSPFQEDIILAAASIAVPEAKLRTGGILGSLKTESRSAESGLFLESGFLFGTFPGKYAFAIKTEQEKAEELSKTLAPVLSQSGTRETVEILYNKLLSLSYDFLFVTDGSGPDAFGMIGSRNELVSLI